MTVGIVCHGFWFLRRVFLLLKCRQIREIGMISTGIRPNGWNGKQKQSEHAETSSMEKDVKKWSNELWP